MKIAIHGNGDPKRRENGKQRMVTFDGNLDANALTGTAFEIIATKPNGPAPCIGGTGSVALSKVAATVTLAVEVVPDEAVTLSNSRSAAGALGDGGGDCLDCLYGRPLANAQAETEPPGTVPPSPGATTEAPNRPKPQLRQLALRSDWPARQAGGTVRPHGTHGRRRNRERCCASLILWRSESTAGKALCAITRKSDAGKFCTLRRTRAHLACAVNLSKAHATLFWYGGATEPGLLELSAELSSGAPVEQETGRAEQPVTAISETLPSRGPLLRLIATEGKGLLNCQDYGRETRDDLSGRSNTVRHLKCQFIVRYGDRLMIEPCNFVQVWGRNAVIIIEPDGTIVVSGTRKALTTLGCLKPGANREAGWWGRSRILCRALVTRWTSNAPIRTFAMCGTSLTRTRCPRTARGRFPTKGKAISVPLVKRKAGSGDGQCSDRSPYTTHGRRGRTDAKTGTSTSTAQRRSTSHFQRSRRRARRRNPTERNRLGRPRSKWKNFVTTQ